MNLRFGPEKLNEHFMALDTICDATQERQDAIQGARSSQHFRFRAKREQLIFVN